CRGDERSARPSSSSSSRLGLKYLAGFLLSLVSSPNGTKITVQSPALCTLCTTRKPRRVFRLPTSNLQLPTSDFRLPTSLKWEVGSWKSEVRSRKT
ncbi:unnamed protein product, partial [Porites lobata]